MQSPKIILLIIVILIIAVYTGFSQEQNNFTLGIGSKAPDFRLQGIDGQYYHLGSFADARILVIIFMANHCPTAQAYEDRIIQMVNDYSDRKVAFACISSNNPQALRLDEMGYTDLGDSFEDMKLRAEDKGYNFLYLYDGDDQAAASVFGAQTTPHVFIFDPERKLQFNGRIDNSEDPLQVTTHDTRNAIDALLSGQPVPVQKTKTFGCSIKWAAKIESAKKAVEQWNAEPVSVEPLSLAATVDLVKNTSDKLRLINVWATWCGPCVTEFPHLTEINRMYRNRKFEMVTISLDNPDKTEELLGFLKRQYASNKNFHYNENDKYAFIDALDPAWPGSLPYTLLVKPGGGVIYRKTGVIDPLELKRVIIEQLGRYYHSN